MSDIVLTASVRQNLLSLQNTADLLSTTQTRLATGKKVNSALDNPTNFFTAAGLDARASDIGNLLDSIGNGVQVLQAADKGITALQKLVDTAKSIANQALQQPTGYSTKASIQFTGTGAASGAGLGAKASDLTDSKLNTAVFTFTNSAGVAATITIGGAATPFDPVAKTATVKTLDQLNTALAVAGVNLSASITGTDNLTFTSTNDGAGQTISNTVAPTATQIDAIEVTATNTAAAPTIVPSVPDAVSQTARATLVAQYNQIIQNLTTTAQDASFNGVNLLDGNSLKLIFNETGKSTLTIAGVNFDPNGLGLAPLTAGTDFTDNVLTQKVLTQLNNASTTLRSQASAFGANLSIVQIRQDFAKNIINVLQTGSSALTLADSNEEAANSQALSTRQSIAVSALALANQSQQSVLQLLRT
ncbi:flagellin [Bradyrhizobium prioriisuperbiae]|uniref:flagellin N-terminal helical domain-containing protein n=1 Tax=Bradyrhizobium prioriisuperbiae TaxID=2854389 RepID=UPI0028F1280A|nr:flagellin [Bradyrhizobium prioritasuperba]